MLLKDSADWTGINLAPYDAASNRGRPTALEYGGYRYATLGEWMLAQILIGQKVPFTPEVGIEIAIPAAERVGKEKERKTYVPDFVLDRRAYLWFENGHGIELIHGFEAKGAQEGYFPRRAIKYVRLLREQRGINIKLLSEPQIKRFYEKNVRLPIKRRSGR